MNWEAHLEDRGSNEEESTWTFGAQYTCAARIRVQERSTQECDGGTSCTVAKTGAFWQNLCWTPGKDRLTLLLRTRN